MKYQEWTFEDKSKWPERGPWDHEPDKVQWQDEATGLPCLALRSHGHWCGYVGVPKGHPFYEKGYSEKICDCKDNEYSCYDHSPECRVEVHGGLTFSDHCHTSDDPEIQSHLICHVPDPGEPDNIWWLGFDCAHAGDKTPYTTQEELDIHNQVRRKMLAKGYTEEQLVNYCYRTLDYVKEQCRSLALQLKEIGK